MELQKLSAPDNFAYIDTYGDINERGLSLYIEVPVWHLPPDVTIAGMPVALHDTETGEIVGYIPENLYTTIALGYASELAIEKDTENRIFYPNPDKTYTQLNHVFPEYQCAGFGYSPLPLMGSGANKGAIQIMPPSSFLVLSSSSRKGHLPDIISPHDDGYVWVMNQNSVPLGLVSPWHSFAILAENMGESELLNTEAPDGAHVFSEPSEESIEWLRNITTRRAEFFDVADLGEIFPRHESGLNYEIKEMAELSV